MNSLIKNEYVYSLFVKCILLITSLFSSALLARYLGPQLRGELGFIYSIASVTFIVATLGVYTAYPSYRIKFGRENILCKFISLFQAMCLLYSLFSIIIIFYTKDKYLTYTLLLTVIIAYDHIISFIYLIELPNKRNSTFIYCSFLQVLYLIICYQFLPASLVFGVGSYIVFSLTKSIYFTFRLDCKFSSSSLELKFIADLVKFGFYPMIALLLTTLGYRVDIIMLKFYDNIPSSDIGIYVIGIALAEKVLLVPDSAKEILISKLAKGKGDYEVARVMRIMFFVSIVIAIVLFILGDWLVQVIFGSLYSNSSLIMQIAVCGCTAMVFFKMISQYNVVNHLQKYNVCFLLIGLSVNIFLNTILIPTLGSHGAAYATVVGYIVTSMLFLYFFAKRTNIKLFNLVFIQKDDLVSIVKVISLRKI